MIRRLARLSLALAGALSLVSCTPLVVPMGPPVAAPQLQDDRIIVADGTALPLRVWRPDGAPRAVILAAHGFNDYSNAFASPAEEWAKDGIVTYAYDQRGFGRAPNFGVWPGTETFVSDLETATVLIARRHRGVPVYVLGESMGGAIAIVAASQGKLTLAAGIILVAPAVRGRETLNIFERVGLWFFSRTVPWLAGRPGSPTGHHPSDNIEMLRALGRDPLVIKNTRVDTFWGLVNLMDDALDASRRLNMPALIQIGANDDLIPDSPTGRMLERLPQQAKAQQRVAVYRRGYHMLLRDLNAAQPIRDVAFFVANHGTATPLPSGAEQAAEGEFAEKAGFR